MAYTEPTPADLKARYPAFADVSDATVQVYLDDTRTAVDGSWPESLYLLAKAAKAAHEMALLGIGVRSEVEGWAAAGLTAIRTGEFNASFSAAKVAKASGGTLAATPYGLIFKRLLRQAKGGPRVAVAANPSCGWGPTAQQNDGAILPWHP
jgi:hypothetical protein